MNLEKIKKQILDLKPHKKGIRTIKEVLIWLLIINGFLFFIQIGDVLFYLVAFLSFLFLLWTIYSFRNPVLELSLNSQVVLAVTNGVITAIRQENDLVTIEVTSSVLDSHINRIPLEGALIQYTYVPGEYKYPWKKEASGEIEKAVYVFETNSRNEIAVIQKAGLFENRIINLTEEGTVCKQGQVMSVIKLFGYTTEIVLPAQAEIFVKTGDKALAGITALAKIA